MFKDIDSQPNFSAIDQEITQWWKENHTFEKSMENRKDDPEYIFYDGPPFMSGIPHYGTLLSSLAKDATPRYKTMQGMFVSRVWGWDCHGLPIEEKVEKELKISGRQEILQVGLDKFIEKCYEWNRVGIENWRWYIEKIGRWADLDNAYRTMDQDYMESVWWAFKTLWDKDLIYKGRRVSMFSTDSSTPVSDFEVSMDPDNYRDTEDLAITVKFELTDESLRKLNLEGKKVFLLAWTTTPWTIPANFALAVNVEATYVLVEKEGEHFVLAKDLYKNHFPEETEPQQEMNGSDLVGLSYNQVYKFFSGNEKDFHVYGSEYVSIVDGTGVLHVAPAFGEEDFNIGNEHGLSFQSSINDYGNMVIGDWQGTYLRDANEPIADDLAKLGHLFKKEKYTHRLPYYRYKNPLIYKAEENYFVNIQKLKPQLLKSNEEINWYPEHFKEGRFKYTLETAPDWCISRSRFWATVMPLWESEDGTQIVVGGRDELMQLVNNSDHTKYGFIQKVTLKLGAGIANLDQFIASQESELVVETSQAEISAIREKYLGETHTESQVKLLQEGEARAYYLLNGKPLNMHRPYIDEVKFEQNGKKFTRTELALDVWMDSGSMPFAQFHYPFANKERFEQSFPGDFIAEYPGQVRAWFYVLHVLANALFDRPAYKNVLVTGVLAGTDGRKMSKSFNNYPDPKDTLDKYGSEALRLYFLGSPLMSGQDINFNEEDLKAQVREFMIPLWNSTKFFLTYANIHEWIPTNDLARNERVIQDEAAWDHIPFGEIENELDMWILAKLQNAIGEVNKYMDEYNNPKAIMSMQDLISELSKWYIRRSRDRFAAGDQNALSVLYYVLVEVTKLIAPIAPFVSEYLYRKLVAEQFTELPESVHLTDYPVVDMNFVDTYKAILPEMEIVRKIAELGQSIRTQNGLKVRQPLAKLEVKFSLEAGTQGFSLTNWMEDIIAAELNVLEVKEVPELTEGFLTAESPEHKVMIALDNNITPELAEQGLAREVIRQIQSMRKNLKFNMGDKVKVTYETNSENLIKLFTNKQNEIMEAVGATSLSPGTAETEVKAGEETFKLKIEAA